ncbi:uncharacterized protein F5Z01DRAFT_342313 [Emericellopsis atlantica]|uniref:Uncharacterized protein n=1 Tax=Emericellopsis atlantica TaxID=2614577 RepID=A0A9P7ZEX0_9HYPO|nr:uncharacterized protein F5Z01DRAFT_342313 [Emericellopsis atlantica]KAG9250824.1 hypothetical protein F5Z01DRAFT_342313 [Emericellopsis atlantica]
MTVDAKDTPKPRFWLLTSPRTASNLLVKILNLEAQGIRPAYDGGYFFMKSAVKRFQTCLQPLSTWDEQAIQELRDAQQSAFDDLLNYIQGAEAEDQKIFVKEHVFMMNDPYFESEYEEGKASYVGQPTPLTVQGLENPTRSPKNLTSMPDEFLKTWRPTFLIRHPAMMLPSLYRTAAADIEVEGFRRPNNEPVPREVTMKWIRTLYEFFADFYGEGSQWPIVLDADDFIKDPALIAKYAPLVGLDADKLRFSWDKTPEEEIKKRNAMAQRMLSSISASTGIDNSKLAGDVDIDAEAVKWREEFGDEGGRKLEQWVRDAIPDYRFLHSKRLRI